jgi:putative iron-regulated protein
MIQDVRGVQNVWLGRYGSVAGTGIRDVIAAGDADLAADVTAQIQESLDLAEALQPPFDREIMAGNTAGNARVDALIVALFELRTVLEGAFELYGLTRIPDPGVK